MARKTLTEEQRKTLDEKREKQLEELGAKLTQAIGQMQEPEGWRAWLDVAGQLPNYCLNNQLLLLFQAAERGVPPQGFASFKRWKELGYPVAKGEKAYRIFGPVLVSKPHDKETGRRIDDEEAKERPKDSIKWKKVPVAYKPVPTFGIEQTAAKDLGKIPDELQPELLRGRAPEGLISKLADLAQRNGAEISTESRTVLGEANGYYSYSPTTRAKKIVIADDLDEAAHAKTLIHELAHMLLHTESDKPRELKEIEAESTAYLVAGTYGLDTSNYTFPYVAGWSGWRAETVEKAAEVVRRAANEILTQLDQGADAPGASAETLTQTVTAIDKLDQRMTEGPQPRSVTQRPMGPESMAPQDRISMQSKMSDVKSPSSSWSEASTPQHITKTSDALTM